MDNEKARHERISELKNKIYYAESARDIYKEKHPILYNTNAFYVDALKLELRGLECSKRV
ncbi:MAG: hypothetical protein WGN25_00275 [Candidatus Electrothrix sp. GW3-4]|uniref:hypothetical protein n=1 Tax=Candidatus Electrothrix sp. GW3-4 TaxID=3126740 RepID=UPI0030D36550